MTYSIYSSYEGIDKTALCLLLQKVNRLLSGDERIINFDTSNDLKEKAIGFTEIGRKKIYINSFLLAEYLDKDKEKLYEDKDLLALVKAINYHELAHILFTDYNIKHINKFFVEMKITPNIEEFLHTLNCLEDCRIESLFSTLYIRAKYYFSFTASKIILYELKKSISENNFNYFLIYGRKYLDNFEIDKIKQLIKPFYKSVESIESCFDRYVIEVNLKKRLQIAYELYVLLKSDEKKVKVTDYTSIRSLSGRKVNGRRLKESNEKLQQQIEQQKEKKKNNEESQNIEKSKKKEENADEKDGDDKHWRKKLDLEIDEQESQREIKKVVNDIIQNIDNDMQQVSQELLEDIQKITASNMEFEEISGEVFKATNDDRLEAKKIENAFKVLRTELQTQVQKNQKRGKFDMSSVIKSQKYNTLNFFKKQELNRLNETRLGVSVIVDSSGSIEASEWNQELRATWRVTTALQNINNKVEVIEFSDISKIIKTFKSEGDWKRHFYGGTRITAALKLAETDLLYLKKHEDIQNLFSIIITDGDFGDHIEAIQQILKMRREGIKVIYMRVDKYFESFNHTENTSFKELKESCNNFIRICKMSDLSIQLSAIVKKMEKEIVRDALRRLQYR